MNAREYIARVYEQVSSADGAEKNKASGAFLGAALAIIQDLDSPVKEQALVSLALLEVSGRRTAKSSQKRAA